MGKIKLNLTVKRVVAALIVFFAFFTLTFIGRMGQIDDSIETRMLVCFTDAFFVSGLALIVIAFFGTFDLPGFALFSYTNKKIKATLSRDENAKKELPGSFYEYKQAQPKRDRSWVGTFYLFGAVSLAVAVVLLVLFYYV